MNLKETVLEATKLMETLRLLIQSLQLSDKRFFTVKNAAAYSDLSEESIRRLLTSGQLTKLRPVRGRIVIDRKELDAYILASTSSLRKGRGIKNTK